MQYQYPDISMSQAPQSFTYKPPTLQASQDSQIKQQNQEPVKEQTQKQKLMEQLSEQLETPANSLVFLQLFQKSAKKVESLQQNLKKMSVYLGTFAAVLFVFAFFSFMGAYFSQMQTAKQTKNSKLKSSFQESFGDMAADNYQELIDPETGNLNIQIISSTLSMFIWGVVMAKARYGFTASSTKCQVTATQSYKKLLGMGGLILLGGLAKLNADNHYVENWIQPQQNDKPKNRNLFAEVDDAQSDTKDSLREEIMTELETLWKQKKTKNAKLNSLKPILSESDGEVQKKTLNTKKLQKSLAKATKMISSTFKQSVWKVVSVLGGIFATGACAAYLYVFTQYKNALAKHDQLTQLFNHPNARVASGEKAKQVAEQFKQHQEQEELKKHQEELQGMFQISGSQSNSKAVKVEPPTIKNLPPKQSADFCPNEFSYSLCESLDYQQESLLPKQQQQMVQSNPTNGYYTLEQVQRLLNLQREEMQRPKPQISQNVPQVQPAQQPQMIFSSDIEKSIPQNQSIPQQYDIQNASLKISQNNNMV